MAVCSRVADYQELGKQLRLQQAILVQPLTRAQVTAYLKEAGRPLAGVRAALREDPQLWELLESPLLLSIVTLTYQGMPASAVRAMGSAEDRRRHLFAAYVARMLERRVRPEASTPAETVRWLSWLAGAMHAHDQTVFYLEQLQPDWLPSRRQRWLVTTGPALTLAVPVTILLFPWFSYATVLGGLMIGVAAWGRTIRPVERLRWTRSGFRRRFLVRSGWGLLIGAAAGIVFDLNANYNEQGVLVHRDFASHLQVIVQSAIFWGLVLGIVGAFISRGMSPRRVVPNEGIRRSARRALLVGSSQSCSRSLVP